MARIAAILYVVMVAGVIVFHIGLIAGKPWGHLTQGGKHEGPLPVRGRIAAGMAIVMLLLMSAALLSAAGMPPKWPEGLGLAVFGAQCGSTVANWMTPSKPERRLWGPVNMVMLVLVVLVVFVS